MSPETHFPSELGPLIGRGRTAEVFAWGTSQVVKLFYASFPQEAVTRERRAAEAVSRSSVPAPAYGGSILVGDRRGLVFDRVVGVSMLRVLSRQPWSAFALARELADVHLEMHARRAADLRSQREFMRERIQRDSELSAVLRAATLERLDRLPDGDRLCHGDFHPDNVMMTASGPMVLDWMNAVQGDAAGDVARTLLLLQAADLPADASLAFKLVVYGLRQVFVAVYWRTYARRSGLRRASVDAWRTPVLAARLGEGIPPTERQRVRNLLERR